MRNSNVNLKRRSSYDAVGGGGRGVGACSGSEDRRGRRAKMAVHLQGVEMERRGRQEATAMRYMRERDSVRIATSIHHETWDDGHRYQNKE